MNPNKWADTIQRPLNESPLNNLPDQRKKEDLEERKVGLQEKSAKRDAEQPKSEPKKNEIAPDDDSEDVDEQDDA